MSVYPIYAVAKRAEGSIPLKLKNIFSYRLCFSSFCSKERGKDGRMFGRPDKREGNLILSATCFACDDSTSGLGI